ncbi:MAG: transcriptional regulator [Caldisphaera sp.]|uniref:transcriptional regulator n=1 Tax=Caldisphaera sp. TaxID=2060322 RepID=UPI0025C45667|nr:transcriptional regulator [Caldisphaera sp.]
MSKNTENTETITIEMPCEIAAKLVIPSIRASIAYVLVNDFKLSKYTAARMLGLTPAAINNYISGKRGDRYMKILIEDERYLNKVKEAAKLILNFQGRSEEEIDDFMRKYQQAMCGICSEVNEVAHKHGCPYKH